MNVGSTKIDGPVRAFPVSKLAVDGRAILHHSCLADVIVTVVNRQLARSDKSVSRNSFTKRKRIVVVKHASEFKI